MSGYLAASCSTWPSPCQTGVNPRALASPCSHVSASGVGSHGVTRCQAVTLSPDQRGSLASASSDSSTSAFCRVVRAFVYRLTWYTASPPSGPDWRSRMSTPPSPLDGVMRTELTYSRLTNIATTASTSAPSSRVHSTRVITTACQQKTRPVAAKGAVLPTPTGGVAHKSQGFRPEKSSSMPISPLDSADEQL